MCGEHSVSGKQNRCSPGSSPHVRGARAKASERIAREGIIPACAGSTARSFLFQSRSRDHPRMCGEHLFIAAAICSALGSSPHVRGALRQMTEAIAKSRDHPRMCGEHPPLERLRGGGAGSSPHVRGARDGLQGGARG